jgi:uncharacterized protein GlcG (DUF336 family)
MRATRNSVDQSPVFMEALESRELLASIAPLPDNERLTRNDVTRILAAAASEALPTQVIVVVDRDGQVLGSLAMKDANLGSINDEKGRPQALLTNQVKALTRARTTAFFESHEDAFTTRTARFIIQDHFPQPLPNTGGGPLYGVQFSSLPGSDVYSGPAISGDPGGIPLFKNGEPVGGIGVAGDGHDVRARFDLPYDPNVSGVNEIFNGKEEHDVDEQVALAGAAKFMAPEDVQATGIFVAGLRFPFTADKAASGNANRTLDEITASGDASLIIGDKLGATPLIAAPYSAQGSTRPRGSPGSPFPAATIAGVNGQFKNTSSRVGNFGLIGSDDTDANGAVLPDADRLTKNDVRRIITQAVNHATVTRAAIRLPIGVNMRVHIIVVDRTGDILGAFRMEDGTNFSYDVAVQKARTAAFFSDNKHAFTARAVGFLSQRFFPTGIEGGIGGPLFHVQNELSLGGSDLGISNRGENTPRGGTENGLQNGITIFPGGAPLYKNGQLVGAIGVSGDGVDQDDITTFAGTKHFEPDKHIRSDFLSETKIINFMTAKMQFIRDNYNVSQDVLNGAIAKLQQGLDDVQLPYIKFPRNSEL